jgi:hypothetical protein
MEKIKAKRLLTMGIEKEEEGEIKTDNNDKIIKVSNIVEEV